MNAIRELWKNKKEPQGRVDITLFFVNIFLLLCHIFLMIVYISVNHKFMIIINSFSILLYGTNILSCIRKTNRYVILTFLEIWIHMLFAVASFGWKPCFQNWSFALIAAYFLPAYSLDNEKRSHKQSLVFSFILTATYFVISVFVNVVDTGLLQPLDKYTTRLLFTANNGFTFFAIVMFAWFYTSSARRKADELSRKADYDQLTGLYNRYSLTQISKVIMEKAQKQKKSYNVAIIDIDLFKDVNDNHGHLSGDDVLKEIANILRFYSNKDIISSRWGGEEFVIITPHTVSYQRFMNILERLRIKVSKTKFKIEDGKTINLTISIGATSSNNYDSLDEAVSIADDNLYKAKKTGRNKIIG